MKKIFAILMIFICLSVTASAVIASDSYFVTVDEADLSGSNYQIYFQRCLGHYDYEKDAATIYVTNTSDEKIDFQVTIGFSGSSEHPTSVESGYVTLEPHVTGKFVLEDLYELPEKANNDLGYVPNSHLGEGSVVRVQARKIKAGDTFIVCGFNAFGAMRDSNYSNIEANAVMLKPTIYEYINEARLVIKKPVEEEKEVTEYTLTQPATDDVNNFITFTVVSFIVCIGGLIIYTVVFVIKRREKND